MASVRKRKWTHNGAEKEAWIVSYTDQSGKRRLKTFDKKKDADKHRIKVETEIEQGIHTPANETMSVRECAEALITESWRVQKLGDLTKGSVIQRALHLRHIADRFGGQLVASLTSEDVQQFVDEMRARYAANTVYSRYVCMVTLLAFCVKRKWVKRNVLRDEPCKVPLKTKRTAVPNKADIQALVNVASELRPGDNFLSFVNRRCLVALGIFGGLRPGEIFGLQWENVDFERAVIRVRNAYSPTDGLKGPKTRAGLRDVPMSPPIRDALLAVRKFWRIHAWATAEGHRGYSRSTVAQRIRNAWDKDDAALAVPDPVGFVCVSRQQSALQHAANPILWRRLMEAAGLYDADAKKAKFTPHAMRHAAASLFIDAGLPPMNLKAVIGHASVKTTYDVYGHLFPEDTRVSDAAHLIAASFARQGSDKSPQSPVE